MSEKINVSQNFSDRFFERTTKMENGCLAWNGGKNIMLPSGGYITPRRAAYLIKNKQMPEREIKLICHTPCCVATIHFVLGRIAKSGAKAHENRLTEKDKAEISKARLLLPPLSVKSLALKYQVSIGTIDRYDPLSKRKV